MLHKAPYVDQKTAQSVGKQDCSNYGAFNYSLIQLVQNSAHVLQFINEVPKSHHEQMPTPVIGS